MRRIHKPRRPGFTLVELLIVLAIASILIAMLLPGVARAKELARRTKCLALERQYGIAHANYALNNRAWYVAQGAYESNLNYLVLWLMTTERRNLLAPYMNWKIVLKPKATAPVVPIDPAGRLPGCPGVPQEFLYDYNWAWGGGGYFQFARVTAAYTGSGGASAPHWYMNSPQRLDDSPRLELVADTFIKYPTSTGVILFNHGKLGGGLVSNTLTTFQTGAEGSNILLTDGSASWRPLAQFSETATGYIPENYWWSTPTKYRGYW